MRIREGIADSGVAAASRVQKALRGYVCFEPQRCEAQANHDNYAGDCAAQVNVLSEENSSLKRLLGFISDYGQSSSHIATSIVRAHDGSNGKVFIPVGRKNGIRNNQAVVDSNGLVGTVADLSDSSATILLLTDKDFLIPVFVVESGVNAIVSGNGRFAYLTGLPPGTDVKEGELIITAESDQGLAGGVYVGNVTASKKIASMSRFKSLSAVSIIRVQR